MLPENQYEYQSGANGIYSQTMEIPNLTLSDLEFRQIKDIVWKTTGISLSDNKKALVISRLARRLTELNMQSFYKYINRLRSDTDELLFMINCITTNLTRFYREKGQFAFLKNTVLPEILEAGKRKQEKTLRLWSAGCSTGEEVYTLLFEIMAYFKGRIPPTLDVKIVGSDIDTGALQKAAAGLYSEEEVKGLQETEIANYFDRVSEDQLTIKNHLKKYVTFLKMNLVYDAFIFLLQECGDIFR
jgi:chemotaxis protein methyltransferase CheR